MRYIITKILSLLPNSLLFKIAQWAIGKEVNFDEVEHNLKICFPDYSAESHSKLIANIRENYAMRIPFLVNVLIRGSKKVDDVQYNGIAKIEEALLENKGAVVVIPDFSVPHIAPGLLALKFGEVNLILHEMWKINIEQWLLDEKLKKQLKNKIHLHTYPDPFILYKAKNLICENKIIAILLEFNQSRIKDKKELALLVNHSPKPPLSRFKVKFLNQHVYVGPGPIKLSKSTGAPLFFAAVLQNGKEQKVSLDVSEFRFRPNRTLEEDLQDFYDQFEKLILKQPEQWMFWDKLYKIRVDNLK